MAKRIWLTVTALVVVGLVFGAITIFGWTVGETHFDRPDESFDRLTKQIEDLPGVSVDEKERWVEAPTFTDPSSWVGLTVDEANLPGLLDIACTIDYPGSVSWSLRIRADGGNAVTVHSETAPGGGSNGPRCFDFGFDAVGLVDAVGSLTPGLDLQPTIWNDDQFALVVLDDPSEGLDALLPLVAHADELREAAGLDSTRSVEINSMHLGVIIEPHEHDRYLALLTELAEEHHVASFSADSAENQTDGVAKVQISAPDREHTAIEEDIRASGLRIADLPVRFLPSDS